MHKNILYFTFAYLLLSTVSFAGGYKNTEWGMSVDEVRKVIQGEPTEYCGSEECGIELDNGNFAVFSFNETGLHKVVYDPNVGFYDFPQIRKFFPEQEAKKASDYDEAKRAIIEALSQKYGTSQRSSRSKSFMETEKLLTWKTEDTAIDFIETVTKIDSATDYRVTVHYTSLSKRSQDQKAQEKAKQIGEEKRLKELQKATDGL